MFFTLFVSCLAAVWLLTVLVAFYPVRWVPRRLRARAQAPAGRQRRRPSGRC